MGYTLRAMEHRFSGPSYTLGIEEELMIVDEETLDLSNSIERLLADLRDVPTEGEVKPELMESVCEIATTPVRNTVEAGAQLRALRRTVNQVAQQHGLAIGSAGTHPFALWEDQRIVARPRYRDLISGLQFVARQEIIFGIHVHVGVDHPDKAIHVTNGMRVHLPLLLALSAQLALLARRQHRPRLHPHADLPRLPAGGHPASLRRLRGLGAPDRVHDAVEGHRRLHLPLVRRPPAPQLRDRRGARDGLPDARGAHAGACGARPGDGEGALRSTTTSGKPLSRYPYEMLDENKWMAARHGLGAQLVDLPDKDRVPVPELTRRLMARLRPHAEALGSEADFDCIEDILDRGNGASRQKVVYEANHDLREVVREILDATVPEHAEATGD